VLLVFFAGFSSLFFRFCDIIFRYFFRQDVDQAGEIELVRNFFEQLKVYLNKLAIKSEYCIYEPLFYRD
jgi:hypothetical protein